MCIRDSPYAGPDNTSFIRLPWSSVFLASPANRPQTFLKKYNFYKHTNYAKLVATARPLTPSYCASAAFLSSYLLQPLRLSLPFYSLRWYYCKPVLSTAGPGEGLTKYRCKQNPFSGKSRITVFCCTLMCDADLKKHTQKVSSLLSTHY